ncbi:hypothetical protein [Tellurirhabdus rosea]|uniref:hypothetical protein n=1 Tax=Tellurirhabdus rosea TaxID=2674997 RepID=UPI00225B4CAF|nr:hypothetical protein [Tellurirhabdus rosea]
MVKQLKYILGLGVMALSLTSCFENPSNLYEGPALVEFKNPRAGFATQPTNNTANAIRTRTIRQAIGRDSIAVQLVGPQRGVATEIPYTVAETSTAREGVNFNFVGTKGTVTIPANSSVGYLILQVLPAIPATAPATQTVSLALTLTGTEEIKPSENYKTFTFTIRN